MKKVALFCLISIPTIAFLYAEEPMCTFSDDSLLKLRTGLIHVVCIKDTPAKFYLNDQVIGINQYISIINSALTGGEINLHSQAKTEQASPTPQSQDTVTAVAGDCGSMPDTIKTLKFKQKSAEIKQAQDILYAQKYLANPPNGYFGAGTLSGIKKFQKDMKLRVTAVLDAATWKKLKDVCLASPQ